MNEPTCENCRFWQETVDDKCLVNNENESTFKGGECRRRAPVLIAAQAPLLNEKRNTGEGGREDDGQEDIRRVFPLTYSWDWCGEHQPRGKPLPQLPVALDRLRETPVEAAGFSQRASRALRYRGVFLIGQLIERTPGQLLEFKNIGATTLEEIRTRLKGVGLSLKGDE